MGDDPQPNRKEELPPAYRVGDAVQYHTFSFSPQAELMGVPLPAARPAAPATVRLPEAAVEEAVPAAVEKKAIVAARPTERRAVWIVHGMGEQVPFETVDSLAQGLLSVARMVPGTVPLVTEVKFMSQGASVKEQIVQRIELDVQGLLDEHGKPTSYQLHLYEAYWAPVTEGVAKVSDVVGFLFSGGLRGILNCFKPFLRAMFPDERVDANGGVNEAGAGVPGGAAEAQAGIQAFTIKKRTPFFIAIVLLLLLALVWINSVVLAAGAATAKLSAFSALAAGGHWLQITSLASAMCAVAVSFGVLLFIALLAKPTNRTAVQKRRITVYGWMGATTAALTILLAAILIFILFSEWPKPLVAPLTKLHTHALQTGATLFVFAAAMLAILALSYRAIIRSRGQRIGNRNGFLWLFRLAFFVHLVSLPVLVIVAVVPLATPAWVPALVAMILGSSLWVWPFLIFFSAQVRSIIVQFPGDVAIYVASQKLDRFDKVRKEIKQIAFDSLCAIYTAADETGRQPEYAKVAVVGHSLGSVVAYDTLNKLLNLDYLCQNRIGVAERTCLLETFGSPLDKIAFFFSIQGKDSHHFREQLASVVQPLIQSYEKFRQIPWINVYSPNDIISGSLDFYDLKGIQQRPPGVVNIADPDAVVPLAAHVDYWGNPLIWQELYKKIASR